MNNPMEKYLGKKPESGVEDATSSSSEQISFSMPSGFKVPDGISDGESFDAMATLKVVGGKLVLDEIDGLPISDYDDSEEIEPETEGLTEDPDPEEDSAPESEEDSEDLENVLEEDDSEGLDFLDAIEKKVGKKSSKKY